MLVPLLNTQGHVKAVVVLLNRTQCTCERMKQIAEAAEKQCACEGHVHLLEPLALAVDAWSDATAPCEHCARSHVDELSYGEFLSRPPSSLDVDCSRHFIGQVAVGSRSRIILSLGDTLVIGMFLDISRACHSGR